MKTVELLLNERDYLRYASNKKRVRFRDVKRKVLTEAFQQSIDRSVKLAKKAGLSGMSMGDINAEIAKVRGE